jgi:hypothetical protein
LHPSYRICSQQLLVLEKSHWKTIRSRGLEWPYLE